jgi:hypothetical protein
VLGKQRGKAAAQQVQQLVQYAAAAVSHPGGKSAGIGWFTFPCLLFPFKRQKDVTNVKSKLVLPLESGRYAANVVLGKQRGEAAAQQVQQLVQYAAAAVSHPGGESCFGGYLCTFIEIKGRGTEEEPQGLN